MTKKINLPDISATEKLAKFIAGLVNDNDVITLSGEIGAGKTTFVRAFINELSSEEIEVTSPTFNLVKTYDGRKCHIWHFDLYRLKNPEELLELGLDEAINDGITIIEWPEMAENYLPENHLNIKLSYLEDKGHRQAIIDTLKGKWQKLNEYK